MTMCIKTHGALPPRCTHSRYERQKMVGGRLVGIPGSEFCTVDPEGRMCDGRDERCPRRVVRS